MGKEIIDLHYSDISENMMKVGGVFTGATGFVGLPALVLSSLDSVALKLVLSVPSAAAGVVGGLILGSIGGFYLGDRFFDTERRLDRKAIKSGVPHVTVAYNNSCVHCPLRADASGSRRFEIRTTDQFAEMISLEYSPKSERPFSFGVGVLDAGERYSEPNCEALIQERVAGIDQVSPSVSRERRILVARADLYSGKVGPDEIFHISTAATTTLATMKEFVDGQRRRF